MSNLYKKLAKADPDKIWLFQRIQMIKTSPDAAKSWLKDLGKNDFEHAEAVEEYLGEIVSECDVNLSCEEIFLILFSVYVHDAGYRIDKKTHPEKTYNLLIKEYPRFFIQDPNLAKAIALICLAHGSVDLNEIPTDFPIDFLSKTKDFNLRFLGSLLRLADDIDQGYLRVFNRIGQQNSPRNSVYHIEIGPQIIKLKTKPNSNEEWRMLKDSTKYIQERLDNIKSIFSAREIKIEQIALYPTIPPIGETHEEKEADKLIKSEYSHSKYTLFLLDHTTLGMDILRDLQARSYSTLIMPIFYEGLKQMPYPLGTQYSEIVWILGEDYEKQLHEALIDKIIQNTAKGGGLILFPFVAWSITQGINDKIEELLPVQLSDEGNRRTYIEGKDQTISNFMKDHEITRGLKSFSIKNTYEKLKVKEGSKCLCSDSDGNPFLSIGSYGLGRVAYLNISSHFCHDRNVRIMDWDRYIPLREIVFRTLKWACGSI